MSTIKTEPSRGSLQAESIDSFFAVVEDEPLKLSAELKTESCRKESEPFGKNQPMRNAYYTEAYDEPKDWWDTALRGVSILCFVAAVAMFARGYFSTLPSSNSNVPKSVLTSTAQPKTLTTKIEDIRLGTRVLGENPIESQAETVVPSPETWNEIHLEMTKQSGAKLWVELLRPIKWLEQHEASTGSTIFLEMHEMGAVGDAVVTFIGPCPEIKSGQGTIVTGRFKHQADENSKVVRLKLQGQVEATGVTANHPYWSIDRQAFVEVGELMEGERVDTKDGESRVVSITQDQYTGFLYNLETLEHVYRVGTLGTLVHNNCVEVYRHINAADRARLDKGLGLLPKGTGGSITDQVLGDSTQFISASLKKSAITKFDDGHGLIKINVKKAMEGGAGFVDHKNVLQHVRRNGLPHNVENAEDALEVLFKGEIPFDAIEKVNF